VDIIEIIKAKAVSLAKTIVLPESEDDRVIKAAELIVKEKIAKVILVGNEETLKKSAASLNVNLEGITIVDPKTCDKRDIYVEEFFKMREKKGITKDKAFEIITTEQRYFGAMMVRMGDADGMVAGSNSPTADVIRAALHVIGTKPGLKTVSSCFVMVTPKKEYGKDGVFVFSDCGVVPDPTSEQLADIACSAAESARNLAGIAYPKVALLTFSSKGSASHPDVDKVIAAVEILKSRNVDFEFDGELQADAAIVPSIGSKKAPGSKVAGNANVLVFPTLEAGNIGYKLVERFSGAQAYGPLLQGLAKPVNDLSRGCSVEDIVNVAAITAASSN
jgi:phosphate acetyltransferase